MSKIHSRTVGSGALATLLLLWILLGVVGCDRTSDPEPRTGGVITTGNNGRVQGRVLAGGVGVSLEVRLIQEGASGATVEGVSNSDDSGVFVFPSAPPGRYRVEAWWHGVLKGRSGQFQVDGDVTGVVVLVIGPAQLSLDLSSLDPVDSVFVDYPSNPGVQDGALWKVQVLRDSAFVLQTHRVGGRWEQWEVTSQEGRLVFRNLTDQRLLDFLRNVDSSAFLVTPHTTALWTFDSIDPAGMVLDLSRFRQNLFVGPAVLRPSPHGRALDGGALREGQIATTLGSSIPPQLRWSATGQQTIEIRFFLEALPPSGVTLLGTKHGPQILVSPLGALSVVQQVVPMGQSLAAWAVFTSFPGKIPLGRWVDLVVSIDESDAQIYAWVGETSLDLFVERSGGGVSSLVAGSSGSFSVGGLQDDWRPGRYRIDEIRVSDTLVFGRGNPIQPIFDAQFQSGVQMGGIERKAGSTDLCTDCSEVFVGTDPNGSERGAYLRWEIPGQLRRARIVVANLVVWAEVAENRSFGVYPLKTAWSSSVVDAAGNWNLDALDASAHTVGPLFSGSTGGICANITDLVQRWIDDPKSNNGIVIRANQLDRPGVNVATSGGSWNTPVLFISYR